MSTLTVRQAATVDREHTMSALHYSQCCIETVSRWAPTDPWSCDNCHQPTEPILMARTLYRGRAIGYHTRTLDTVWDAVQVTNLGRIGCGVGDLRILAQSYGAACAIARAIRAASAR